MKNILSNPKIRNRGWAYEQVPNNSAGNVRNMLTTFLFLSILICVASTKSVAQNSIFYDVSPCALGQGPQTGKLILLSPSTGGVPPYVYSISSGQLFDYVNNCFTGLASGAYTVTTTDNVGTAISITANVGSAYPLIVVTASITVPATCTSNTATACVSAIGGTGSFTFKWFLNGSQVATGPCPANLAPGNYTVVAQDNGCSCASSANLDITTPQLTVTTTTVDSDCVAPNCNGVITLTMSGGTTPYTIDWTSGGLTDASAASDIYSVNSICPGTYVATVTDANGCSAAVSVVVNLTGADVAYNGIPNVTGNPYFAQYMNDLGTNDIHFVTTNTTWNAAFFGGQTDILVNSNIVVVPGVTLTIVDLNFHITPKHAIRLQPSAVISASGSSFDVICGTTWRGFEATGACINSSSRSHLLLENCTVTHAEAGIRNYYTVYPAAAQKNANGGIVVCTATNFIDNVMDVVFMNDQSDALNPMLGNFDACHFTIQTVPTPQETPFNIFSGSFGRIILNHVSTVNFNNCVIENLNPAYSNPTTSRVSGIVANFSCFRVMGNAASTPEQYVSSIRGFRVGVLANNSFLNPGACPLISPDVSIAFTNTLVNCFQGVTILNSLVVNIDGNYFGDMPAGFSNAPSAGESNLIHWGTKLIAGGDIFNSPIVIYKNNCHDFSNAAAISYGLYAWDLGPTLNFAVGNVFQNMPFIANAFDLVSAGMFLRFHNRGKLNNAESGLHYECNTFDNNKYDVYISGSNVNTSLNGPAGTQGKFYPPLDALVSAGNKFTTSFDGVANPGTPGAINSFNYNDDIATGKYILPNGTNEYRYYPTEICPTNLLTEMTASVMNPTLRIENLCDGFLEALPSLQNLSSSYEASKADFNSINTIYTALVDGGNTEALKEVVALATFNDALDLYYTLMQKSPALSEEVMLQAIANEYALPRPLLTAILASNPSAAKNPSIRTAIEGREDPLSEAQWMQIMSGETTWSVKEILEQNMMVAQSKRDAAQHQAFLKLDDEATNYTSLFAFLDEDHFIQDRYTKANLLISHGAFEEGISLLSDVPNYFTLSAKDATKLSGYISFLNLQHAIYSSVNAALTPAQRTSLVDLWESDPYGLGTLAVSILIELEGFVPEYPEIPEENVQPGSNSTSPTASANKVEKAILYPNPVNNLLLLNTEDFGGLVTEIRISSLEGRLVLKVPVEDGLTQSALDLTGIRGGSYMVSLIDQQGAILKTLPLLKND